MVVYMKNTKKLENKKELTLSEYIALMNEQQKEYDELINRIDEIQKNMKG
jgi:hypothetical protein